MTRHLAVSQACRVASAGCLFLLSISSGSSEPGATLFALAACAELFFLFFSQVLCYYSFPKSRLLQTISPYLSVHLDPVFVVSHCVEMFARCRQALLHMLFLCMANVMCHFKESRPWNPSFQCSEMGIVFCWRWLLLDINHKIFLKVNLCFLLQKKCAWSSAFVQIWPIFI